MTSPYRVAGAGLLVGALLLAGILAIQPADGRSELLLEVGKAAVGLFPVAFFSVVVAELLKRRDAEQAAAEKRAEADQARAERRDADRRAFRSRAIAAYNQSKATRRLLRGAGLRPGSGVALTEGLLGLLDDQVRLLSEAQLTFEQLHREVEAAGSPFEERERLVEPLSRIEKYLNRVVKNWELGRARLRPGGDADQLEAWTHYRDFVADKEADHLPDNPTQAFRELEDIVLRQLEAPLHRA